MIIGIDIRPLASGRRSGVEEYTINLLDNLFRIDQQNKYKLFCNSFKTSKFDHREFEKYDNVEIVGSSYPNKLLNFSFKFFNWPKIDKLISGVDIFFEPNILFSAVSSECRSVVTYHDLSYEFHANFYSLKRRLWHFFINPRKKARRADSIIAVSESTKNDLVNLFKIDPKKITVIHSGINLSQCADEVDETSDKQVVLPENYILYLGVIEPRKNIIGIISAFNKLKSKHNIKQKLVLAGSKGWKYDKIFKKIENSPYREDIIILGSVGCKEREELYRRADLFVFPSFYEGFGFPPLEAMAAGVPVVTSHVSSLPEVCDQAALYVDPYNVEDIYQVMWQGLCDADLRANLVAQGRVQVEKFKWENTAREVLALFNKITVEK